MSSLLDVLCITLLGIIGGVPCAALIFVTIGTIIYKFYRKFKYGTSLMK